MIERAWRLALGTVLMTSVAWAQGAPAVPTPPPGHPPVAPSSAPAGDVPPGHPSVAPAPSGEGGALPPGHPTVAPGGPVESDATGGMAQLPNFRQLRLPESLVADAPQLPAGVLLVRVVDVNGNPVSGVVVHLGALREGERTAAGEMATRADGVAQFERLDHGPGLAYRASLDADGARTLSSPFQMPAHNGFNVQLVKFDADRDPHSVLISDARVEIAIQDDRLIVVERAHIVNFSNMSLTGQMPHPTTFVPPGGLRFPLPAGYMAFRADEQTMGDQRVVEEGNAAVVHGSFPPTGAQENIAISFQYRIKLDGPDVSLDLAMPLPVLRVTVISQAPPGMHLEVAGMQPAEERVHDGERILLTGRERTSRDDAPIDQIRVRITGLPEGAGIERKLATLATILLVVGALGFAGWRRGGWTVVRKRTELVWKNGTPLLLLLGLPIFFVGALFVSVDREDLDRPGRKAALEHERERLLAEAAQLARDHAAGEVGPETYARRRRALAHALAVVLKDLAEADGRPTTRPA